jgi:NDP-sugar pyrophosphorylase family protein
MLKFWPGQYPLCFREKELVKMKTCLICPSERPSVAALAQAVPLSNFPILGKNLLEYWLEHLAGQGAKQVHVLTADRPGLVRQLTGNGARWGLNVEVIEEAMELSPALARAKYPVTKAEWLAEPHDTILMTHFPGLPEYPLLASYADWFSAVLAWLPHAATINRIGVRELKPGVWVAMHARIADTVQLQAPCWIGEGVRIGPRSVIGPNAILEDHVLVESDCEISHAMVGPETLLGKFSGLKDSLAWGGTMVDWKNGSLARVPDPFLMCALHAPLLPRRATDRLRQLAALVAGYNEEFHLLWKRRRIKLP